MERHEATTPMTPGHRGSNRRPHSHRRVRLLTVLLLLVCGLVAAQSGLAIAQTSTVTLNPTQGPPGTTVTGTGSNWTPGDHIQAYWGDDNSTLGSQVVV